jgi:hypothetical protein
MCEHPEKVAFRSLRAAADFALAQLEQHGRLLRPYKCSCDSYHLTSKSLELGGQLTAAMVRALVSAVS